MSQLAENPNARYQRKHYAGVKSLLLELKQEFEALRAEIRTSVLADRPTERQHEQQPEDRR
jgi:hypothetical protein